jgi:RHS repeat-associated protein
LATITRSRGATTVGTTAYAYNANGDVTSIQSQDGSGHVLASYQYNYGQGSGGSSPSLGGIGAGVLSTAAVSDLLFSETDNGVTTNYGYDAQNQLTSAGATAESYDGNGNRTNSGYVTGADNRLLTDGTWNYSYDAAGNTVKKVNITTGETWTYGYDFNNRMTSAVDSGSDGTVIQSVAYQYDAFGNRVEQDVTANGATAVTRYAYDRGNAWADLDGNNNALETRHLYLDGPDQPVARISASGDVAWYLTDHLGSVRDIVNDNGVVLDHIDYDAFGNVTNETNPAQGDRFGWAGGIRDAATGLNFFNNRYYDPQTGRWTTKDQSGFTAGDANLYRYVGNNVANATDPAGLSKITIQGDNWKAVSFESSGWFGGQSFIGELKPATGLVYRNGYKVPLATVMALETYNWYAEDWDKWFKDNNVPDQVDTATASGGWAGFYQTHSATQADVQNAKAQMKGVTYAGGGALMLASPGSGTLTAGQYATRNRSADLTVRLYLYDNEYLI